MSHHLITYKQLIESYGFDPDKVKPYQIKQCLIRNNVNYHTGFNGLPCVTLEALNHAMGIPISEKNENPEQIVKIRDIEVG